MEAILPLRISPSASNTLNITNNHDHYGYNVHDLIRARILIYSIEYFWRGDQPFEIYVVCPDDELEQVSNTLVATSSQVKLHFMAETSLFPEFIDYKIVSGWHKQQIIKLSAYKIVKSDYYLTLDSDLVACKVLDGNSFFYNEKIINDWEVRIIHESWWEISAKILGKSSNLETHGLKPTPVVISTQICRELHKSLDFKYNGMSWRPLLENLGWSEFSLYNIFMDATGLGAQHHCTQKEIQESGLGIRSAHSFSTEKHFVEWRPERAFSPKSRGFFMVCNSVSLVHPEKIWQKLRTSFENAPDYSYFDT